MPYKSKAQQRFMFSAESKGDVPKGTAERWAKHTKNIKKLPENVSDKKKQEKKAAQTDAFNDSGYRTFADIMREVEVPAFVKEASVDMNSNEIATDNFADTARRKYPLMNKAAAWLSREYFLRNALDFYDDKTADMLLKKIASSVRFWNIEAPNYLEPEVEVIHKVAMLQDGQVMWEGEVSTPEEYKAIAQQLFEKRASYTFAMRNSLARSLSNLPAHLRTELPEKLSDYLEKAAGFGCMTKPKVCEAILMRVASTYTHTPEYSAELRKLAEDIHNIEMNPANLHKIATMMDIVDRATELHRCYDKIATPEEACFGILQKHAQVFVDGTLPMSTGTLLVKQALINKKAVIDRYFKEYMGEIPYSNTEEMLDVIGTLPRPDAAVLEKTLAD